MAGLQSFTLRSGDPEQSVDLGAAGGVMTAAGATVYYRDEPGVTVATADGSLAAGSSVTLYGTQWFATVASRADVLVSVPPLANVPGDLIHTGAKVSLFSAGTSVRIPFSANPTINGPAVVATGTENLVGFALNPKVRGDFTGIAGSDPGFWWGMNVFAIVDADVNGLTTPHGGLIELAVLKQAGILSVARGMETGVSFFGAGAGAKVTQAESLRVSAPTRKVGNTTFTATSNGTTTLTAVSSFANLAVGNYLSDTAGKIPADTTIVSLNSGASTMVVSAAVTAGVGTISLGAFQDAYCLFIEDVGTLGGSGSRFSLFVAGGVVRFGGRVDVTDNISNNGSGGLIIYAGFADADGGRLQLEKTASGGHFRARMAVANAEFQVHDGTTTNWSVSRTGLPKWNLAGNQQTTVGAAGGASALPATPTKYLKVVDSAGTTLVIPAYAP